MTQYIDKSDVVAEIERRIKEGEAVVENVPSSAIFGLIQAYKNVISFIDTLEVKEKPVSKDLEKAAHKYIHGKYSPWLYSTMHDCFKTGAKWQKEQMVDKACEWWENELTYPSMTHEEIDYYQSKIVAFRKAMEE